MHERDPLRYVQSAMEHSPLPIVAVADRNHVIVSMNDAFRRLLGSTQNALIGRPIADVLPNRKNNQCLPLLERVFHTRQAQCLAEQEHFLSASQRVYWSYAMWAVPTADQRPTVVMIQITDMTEATVFRRRMLLLNEELRVSEARLQALATTDGLTELTNHRAFHERLREEITRAIRYNTPLSMLLVDVDHFKSYNDTYGHPAGDATLRQVANVLQATTRANDMVARYGGEEFAVLLPETDAPNALLAAERCRAAVEASVRQTRQITISVGTATLSSILNDSALLINAADKALYCSKKRGRNCVTHSMDAEAADTRGLPEGQHTAGFTGCAALNMESIEVS